MRGKLSHREGAPVRGPHARGRVSRGALGYLLQSLVSFTLAFSFSIALTACNGDGDGNGEGTAEESPSVDKVVSPEADPNAGPFEWPEDPSHPVIELTVSTKDRQGEILIELMPELAPGTVVGVVELADEGFYDGTTFHRVIPGFMIQGGDPNSRDRDPTNDGTGAAGRPLQDEFSRAPFLRGVVGMGNKGRQNSTSTQFFIMQADNRNLDGRYNVVGRVLSGMEFVDAVTEVDIDRTGRWGPKDRPIENVVIEKIRPIGQIAAIRSALDLEREPEADGLETDLAHSGMGAAGGTAVSQPASMDPGEDWEALEAGGR